MRQLIFIAIPFFFIHALEEYLREFYVTDSVFSLLGGAMNISPAFAFVLVQVALFAVLLTGVFFTHRLLLILIGIVFAIELSHVYVAIRDLSLVPGFLTALPLILIGVLYWWQLLKTFLNKYGKGGSGKSKFRYNTNHGS